MAGITLESGYWRAAGMAAVISAVAVAIIHWAGGAAGASMIAETPGGTNEISVVLAAVQGVVFTLVGAAFGWIAARFTESAGNVWLAGAVVMLLLFGLNAFNAAEDTGTAVILNIEHLAVFAASYVWVYPRLTAQRT